MQAIGSGYQYYNYPYSSSTPVAGRSFSGSGDTFGRRHIAEDDFDDNQKLAMSSGGLVAVSLLLHKVSEFFAKKLSNGKEFTSFANVDKVANQMLKENNLKNKVSVEYIDHSNKYQFGEQMAGHLEEVAAGRNAFYMDQVKLAVAPKSKPSLILHELGHAINAHEGSFMKFLQKSRNWAMAVPSVLITLNNFLKKKDDKKQNFVQRNAGLIGFSAFLPTIIEEGMASWRGIKAAKKVLGNSANVGILKRNYAFALGTYILSGIGLGLTAKQAVMD